VDEAPACSALDYGRGLRGGLSVCRSSGEPLVLLWVFHPELLKSNVLALPSIRELIMKQTAKST
jgi:hypothetical protein